MTRKSGQVTVFLSLVLMCTCSLICVLLESARTAGARWYMQTAVNSSLESVLAGYHRELWESYHLLLLEANSQEEVEADFLNYFQSYADAENWYSMSEARAEVKNWNHITDEGGRYLQDEILDYMKYGIFTQIEVAPENAEELLKQVKEAGAASGISSSYNSHTKKAVKLEQALEEISASLGGQERIKNAGLEALHNCDGGAFLKHAGELIKELKRMPGLVARYEKQADILAADIGKSRINLDEKTADLSDSTRQALEEELHAYETYILEDGERRKEVRGLISLSERNTGLIQSVKQEADEVIQYINDWEPADDELDEEELWEPVRSHLQKYEKSSLSRQAGVADKKKQAWLEQITSMAGSGLLSFIMPEGKAVSVGVWNTAWWPSRSHSADGNTDGDDLIKRALVNQYCQMVCTDVLSETDENTYYEMEYLIAGEESDRENLSKTVLELLAVRTGLNLIHILSDPKKKEEARALGAVIAGSAGLAPLASVLAVFIMGVWALGEGIMDLRILLQGGKIPVLKSSEDWNLDLEGLLRLGEKAELPNCDLPQNGFSYQGYLKLLLLPMEPTLKYYRLMDIIQSNISKKQPGFNLENAVYMVDINCSVCGKHNFFSLNMVDNLAGKTSSYEMTANAGKSY
ncbi:hypothetical protein GPL15_06490 [Clostridium sp. MCC353]|uniref:DUF5702 domain-containing protein n=1 Tax=Clostridium sp. MCC353 TaxID=2592646 RepID=UPI001C01C122|nr:DUF5702 domain-containing protein [Clostridium sp. MCC353]MBT9776153.1 hypothetical protein [Clostridium sp. MCC353]